MRQFRWFNLAVGMSISGDFMASMALGWFIGQKSESSVGYAGLQLIASLLNVALGTWAGSYAKHAPRLRRSLVCINLVLIGVSLALAEALGLNDPYLAICLLFALSSIMSSFKNELESMAFDNFQTTHNPLRARRKRFQSMFIARIIIGVIGGYVLESMGPAAMLRYDAVTYVFVILVLAFIKIHRPRQLVVVNPPSFVVAWYDGVRHAWGHVPTRAALLLVTSQYIFCAVAWIFLPRLVQEQLVSSGLSDGTSLSNAKAYGLIVAGSGIGGLLVCSFSAAFRSQRLRRIWPVAIIVAPIAQIGVALSPSLGTLLLAYMVFVTCAAFIDTVLLAYLDTSANPPLLRAAHSFVWRGIAPGIWVVLAAGTQELQLSTANALLTTASTGLVLALALLALNWRHVRAFLALAVEQFERHGRVALGGPRGEIPPAE